MQIIPIGLKLSINTFKLSNEIKTRFMKIAIMVIFMLLSMSIFAGNWRVYKIDDFIAPKNDITSISFDNQGSLWIATSYGIYKYENGTWLVQSPENIYVRTLYIDKYDVKWAGLLGGGVISKEKDRDWKNIPEASKSLTVNVINSDSTGAIWVGDWNEGLFIQKKLNSGKQQWINYRAADDKKGDRDKIGDNAILSIIADSKNRMWIGSYHGLSMFDNNKWSFYDMQNSDLPDNNVYSLATDKNGDEWIGTGNGLVKIDINGWTIYNNENSGLSCDLILSLAAFHGNIWVGSNKGVFFYNGDTWVNYNTENSELPDNRIQSIVIHENKVYLGTSCGLAVFEP
jgi:ligand-binding sensor domain-containing protein